MPKFTKNEKNHQKYAEIHKMQKITKNAKKH